MNLIFKALMYGIDIFNDHVYDCMFTGCAIKNWSHTFNHTCSHARNPFNFKSAFICYLSELSFEVYNFFLGQLAKIWGVIKVWSPKQKCLEKVHFTSLAGYNLNCFANFELTPFDFCTETPTCVCFDSCDSRKWQKIQIIACETSKIHLFQTFLFFTSNLDNFSFLSLLI